MRTTQNFLWRFLSSFSFELVIYEDVTSCSRFVCLPWTSTTKDEERAGLQAFGCALSSTLSELFAAPKVSQRFVVNIGKIVQHSDPYGFYICIDRAIGRLYREFHPLAETKLTKL
jgi:hypothetical protein